MPRHLEESQRLGDIQYLGDFPIFESEDSLFHFRAHASPPRAAGFRFNDYVAGSLEILHHLFDVGSGDYCFADCLGAGLGFLGGETRPGCGVCRAFPHHELAHHHLIKLAGVPQVILANLCRAHLSLLDDLVISGLRQQLLILDGQFVFKSGSLVQMVAARLLGEPHEHGELVTQLLPPLGGQGTLCLGIHVVNQEVEICFGVLLVPDFQHHLVRGFKCLGRRRCRLGRGGRPASGRSCGGLSASDPRQER